MKCSVDHIGIAVESLELALAFYRDALGLEVDAPEEIASQRVRAHFLHPGEGGEGTGGVTLELLEATAEDSPVAKFVAKRGPGIHHVALRVPDIVEALAELKARGVRLIDETPRTGAHGALIAFLHPSSTHGVLVELKQAPA
jgi:methylmalonyl-CoA/ethylmalonyl-CoA epimerase